MCRIVVPSADIGQNSVQLKSDDPNSSTLQDPVPVTSITLAVGLELSPLSLSYLELK
jgi:hypothetical protein